MRPLPPEPPGALRLAVVTNIPAPYRVPVYDRIAAMPGVAFHAIYAARNEPDRRWDLPPFAHAHTFLAERVHRRGGRFIHSNPDVWPALRRFAPDVVVTTGYNPTHLLAFVYTRLLRRAHVVMTDGTDQSEAGLSAVHRAVRRLVFAGSRSFVVASAGGTRLLRGYGVPAARIHLSPLCANTAVDWSDDGRTRRDVDFLFSGRLVDIKNAGFAIAVAHGVAQRLQRRVTLAILGHGPDEAALRAQAAALAPLLDVQFAGHVAQADVPRWFLRARLFLFPTRWDPWGVVANEACLAGVPVLVSPHAGAAGDLVIDDVNGHVLPLDAGLWIARAADLLTDAPRHQRYAAAARAQVARFSFDHAAQGIADAARQALA